MADKNLQFLDVPRKDPDKLAGASTYPGNFAKIYSQYKRRERRGPGRRGGACPAANPFCEWKCPVHNYHSELADVG